ncbi:MAG: DDE-type integrase/transposase/recombinase, partial [Burkholderiales bacterium]
MIDRDHKLPVKRQCELLELARSTAYYQPQEVCQRDLDIMRCIDELHLQYPFAGSRTILDWLMRGGFEVGRRHVRTLMRRMGVNALYPKPRTSIPTPKATIYPYLLKGVCIEKANHVWATDITYIPLAKGCAYLVAILDLATRRVLAWRLSNTMSTDFCI